jgi:hypothetical protein
MTKVVAGGFLTKTEEQVQQGAGRFGDALGGMYSNILFDTRVSGGAERVGGNRKGSRLLERRSRIPVGFIQLAAEAGAGGMV